MVMCCCLPRFFGDNKCRRGKMLAMISYIHTNKPKMQNTNETFSWLRHFRWHSTWVLDSAEIQDVICWAWHSKLTSVLFLSIFFFVLKYETQPVCGVELAVQVFLLEKRRHKVSVLFISLNAFHFLKKCPSLSPME